MRSDDWRPVATAERLRLRARLLASTREFFATRQVLEVDTPALIQHAVTDVHLQSLAVHLPEKPDQTHFLHTSPEYAMKRLLAAGSGDIYQICHVFRGGEQGPLHNIEFTLIEWYRLGFSMRRLMDEVAALLQMLLGESRCGESQFVSYCEAMQTHLGIDPLQVGDSELAECAAANGFDGALLRRCGRDELLDLLMGARVGPRLGRNGLCFLHRYPLSQAALAKADPADTRVALRFEVYLDGIELANGFEELADPGEQQARFELDLAERARRGLPAQSMDPYLLAALRSGLPACSGVAVGFDRVVLLAAGARQLEEVLAFPVGRA